MIIVDAISSTSWPCTSNLHILIFITISHYISYTKQAIFKYKIEVLATDDHDDDVIIIDGTVW